MFALLGGCRGGQEGSCSRSPDVAARAGGGGGGGVPARRLPAGLQSALAAAHSRFGASRSSAPLLLGLERSGSVASVDGKRWACHSFPNACRNVKTPMETQTGAIRLEGDARCHALAKEPDPPAHSATSRLSINRRAHPAAWRQRLWPRAALRLPAARAGPLLAACSRPPSWRRPRSAWRPSAASARPAAWRPPLPCGPPAAAPPPPCPSAARSPVSAPLAVPDVSVVDGLQGVQLGDWCDHVAATALRHAALLSPSPHLPAWTCTASHPPLPALLPIPQT